MWWGKKMPAYKGRKIRFNTQMMILSRLPVFFIPGDFYLDLEVYTTTICFPTVYSFSMPLTNLHI